MRFETMVEVNAAMHLSYEVESEFKQRGGLIYVAPPGQLKTSGIEAIEMFPHCRVVSNLTVKSLSTMRQDFISGQIQTLAISDLENIYRRAASGASHIEGILMGLVDEGWRLPAFSDQRTSVLPAHCSIIAGLTVKQFEERISPWLDNGFARRFLWAQYSAHRSVIKKLEQSIIEWKKFALVDGFTVKLPISAIPMKLTDEESKKVLAQLRFQHDHRTPFITAKKIIAVLMWKFRGHPEKAWEIWDDFAPALGKDGTQLTL